MKDRLFEIAFEGQAGTGGELTEGDRRELARLKALKADLTGLRGVPECQLTTDHLRRAVLDGGIRPRPAARPWFALALPAVAATLALALALAPRPTADVVLGGSEATLALAEPVGQVESAVPVLTQAEEPASSQVAPAAVRQETSTVRNVATRARSTRREVRPSPPLVVVAQESSVATASPMTSARARPGTGGSSIPDEAVTRSDARPEPEPVIVVYDATHSGTGVQIATERHDAANLVAGY